MSDEENALILPLFVDAKSAEEWLAGTDGFLLGIERSVAREVMAILGGEEDDNAVDTTGYGEILA